MATRFRRRAILVCLAGLANLEISGIALHCHVRPFVLRCLATHPGVLPLNNRSVLRRNILLPISGYASPLVPLTTSISQPQADGMINLSHGADRFPPQSLDSAMMVRSTK
jgi:hypothetical protein